jgi:DNA-directed RNA polymerase subunit A'
MHVSKKIKSITFGIASPKLIKKMAAAKVVTPELYDTEGYPVDGGLMDVRLGVIDPGLRCKTCGGKLKECDGHFGYIELARPVIHVKYFKQILDFLRCTCRGCGRILVDDEGLKKHLEKISKKNRSVVRRKKIRAFINNLKNIKKCPHCGIKQLNIKIEKPTTFLEDNKRLSPIDIRTRLEKISDDDITALGFNPEYAKPEWLILTLLPIPPVTARPSITLESGERSEDDLTHKLSDIVRINQRLFENINAGAPEVIIEDLWDLLQYHVTTFFDNALPQVPPARHRSGQPLKTLTERIKSKQGRFRHNLTGKRVNFSARAVISPDPKIKFNEVGIPVVVATTLTVPERVTEWNIDWLKEFIKKGSNVYPGANSVIRPDGKKKKITDETREQLLEELQPGYIVERHLMDGDVAIFNRQPSLHRMSVMCHKIRVLPGKSFRLNPATCFPYNADFDGDEMNLHVPQTEEARSEAEYLMIVQKHLITPKNGLNVIGCIDDSIVGNYLLTKEKEIDKEEAVDMLVSIGIDDSKVFKKFISKVSGKEIFSALLPNDFDFIGYSRAYVKGEKNSEDAYVKIKKGMLISGVIDKNTVGIEKGTLIRELNNKYGEGFAIEILIKIFKLGVEYMLRRGFSTAISDIDFSEKTLNKFNHIIEQINEEVEGYIKKYKSGKLKAFPGMNLRETVEFKILKALNKVRDEVGKHIIAISKEKNPNIVMFNSGATGNILNMVQMAALVGQQALRGKRIEFGYKNRTLTLFKKGDISPEAKGFIKNSFKGGLKPYEFFYGAITGRDALMDTALRTPKSGYLYRRLANALQDLKVEYDNTVRDANKVIVQFKYGEDGLDVSRTQGGVIDVHHIVKNVIGK